jgi:hypothetical protein
LTPENGAVLMMAMMLAVVAASLLCALYVRWLDIVDPLPLEAG